MPESFLSRDKGSEDSVDRFFQSNGRLVFGSITTRSR